MKNPSNSTNGYMPVADFYNGKSILITGATGFLGKLLLEKLLWSCPGIDKIYLLIRPKEKEDEGSRLATILQTPVFDRIRKTRPNDFKKIIVIPGDLSNPHLNISQADRETLMKHISVVFHVAASVRFNNPLKTALTVNAVSTKYLAEFSHQMHRIESFVYVSTAFCNCNLEEVKEEIYSLSRDPETIINLMELADDDIADALTPRLIDQWPNTYTFAKAVAENLLQKHCTQVPIAIVRPSIVTSTIQKPEPGWNDSLNGPTQFVVGIMKGLLHGLFGNGHLVADLIPADFVVNLIICAAWKTANTPKTSNIDIYHVCSSHVNPITWEEFMGHCVHLTKEYPAKQVLTHPFFSWQRYRFLRFIQMVFLEQLPAYIFDLINYLTGKNTQIMQFHRKLIKASYLVAYFLTRQWKFLDDNTQTLMTLLNDDDRRIFPFNAREIYWPDYIKTYYLGIRENILNKN